MILKDLELSCKYFPSSFQYVNGRSHKSVQLLLNIARMYVNATQNSYIVILSVFIFLALPKQIFAQGLKLVPQVGHNSFVNSASYSPDGKRIVTSSGDIAKVWPLCQWDSFRS